jgi:pimeloyl-ACP methyl ester carboxylesterase
VDDWRYVQRNGVQLAHRALGGGGRSALFIHGLAGHSGEWSDLARHLEGFSCHAMDQRGHGRSQRRPGDLTREAFVEDVAALVEALDLAPVILIGQSMGANTAFLTAARHPKLVSALIVIEASPDGPAPELAPHVDAWLRAWPASFPDLHSAQAFFAAQGLAPGPWSGGLEWHDGALRPGFEKDVMVECTAELAGTDYWEAWRQIRCPTLVVRGVRGNFDEEHVQLLASLLPCGASVSIPDAGHEVHLDAPQRLAVEIGGFIASHSEL